MDCPRQLGQGSVIRVTSTVLTDWQQVLSDTKLVWQIPTFKTCRASLPKALSVAAAILCAVTVADWTRHNRVDRGRRLRESVIQVASRVVSLLQRSDGSTVQTYLDLSATNAVGRIQDDIGRCVHVTVNLKHGQTCSPSFTSKHGQILFPPMSDMSKYIPSLESFAKVSQFLNQITRYNDPCRAHSRRRPA